MNQSELTIALSELKSKLSELINVETDKINFFAAVGMTKQEIKHSAFLAWLLRSSEVHNLRSAVAEKLLSAIYSDRVKYGSGSNPLPNADILMNTAKVADKNDLIGLVKGRECKVDTEVITEDDKRIDILIDVPQTRTVVVIENKTFTLSHDDQLINYQKYIENPINGFSDYSHKIYVYLSPFGEMPINYGGDEKYNASWCISDYKIIAKIIDDFVVELRGKDLYPESKGRERTKLISILEDYSEMIKTDILAENPDLIEECKKIMDNKRLREAFDLLTSYSQTATADKVIAYARKYIGAVDDGSKGQRWFYTQAMKEFFMRQGEQITNRLCRCVCQPIGASAGVVGVDICISLEKTNGAWTNAQKKILNATQPNREWENKTFSGPKNSRVVLVTGNEQGKLFEDIKSDLGTRLDKFRSVLNDFEDILSKID